MSINMAPYECPECKNQDMDVTEFEEVDNFEASRKVACNVCGHKWWEIYRFSHTEWIEEE